MNTIVRLERMHWQELIALACSRKGKLTAQDSNTHRGVYVTATDQD